MSSGNTIRRVPLHRQVGDALRSEIASATVGRKLESEQALSKRFGVSLLTVREALSALAQEGLVERRHGSGTFIRRAATGSHAAVLSDLEIDHPSSSFFFQRVSRQVRAALHEREIPSRLYVSVSQAEEGRRPEFPWPELTEATDCGHVRGAVAIHLPEGSPWPEALRSRSIPVVGGRTEGMSASVTIDYGDIVRQGVRYLVGSGCRRIGLMNWRQTGPTKRLAEVFSSEVAAAGARTTTGWISDEVEQAVPTAGAEAFRAIWLTASERPDGLLVLDDVLFCDAALAMMMARVRLPQDLLVITHANVGNIRFAEMPVARLQVDPDVYAARMVSLLVDLLDGQDPPERHVRLTASLRRPAAGTVGSERRQ